MTTQEKLDLANEIKVGDELAFRRGYGSDVWSIARVSKITPSGRIVCGCYTLNPDLTIRGDRDYSSPFRGEIVTDEIRKAIKRQTDLMAFRNIIPKSLSDEQLARIVEISQQQKGMRLKQKPLRS